LWESALSGASLRCFLAHPSPVYVICLGPFPLKTGLRGASRCIPLSHFLRGSLSPAPRRIISLFLSIAGRPSRPRRRPRDMDKTFDPQAIEQNWYNTWEDRKSTRLNSSHVKSSYA